MAAPLRLLMQRRLLMLLLQAPPLHSLATSAAAANVRGMWPCPPLQRGTGVGVQLLQRCRHRRRSVLRPHQLPRALVCAHTL